LLIVVAIIGILASIALPNFLQAQVRAKMARVKSEMRTIATSLETYRVDNNHYPWFDAYGFPPRYNEISYRLIQLTTPVDYLPSVGFYDPFLPGTDDAGYGDGILRHHYNYRNHEFFNSSILGTPVWVLNCIGPDRYPDQGLLAEMTARGLSDATIIYDPTNGVITKGDVPYTGGQTKFVSNWH
jgi:hypothetical protein